MFTKSKHQVAGHGCGDTKLAPVVDDAGCFYKPLQNGTRGEREAEFYSRVLADTRDPDPEGCSPSTSLRPLLNFMPRSYGTAKIVVEGAAEPLECLKLEDITCSYQYPCVMDLKMGFRTWYKGCPEARKEKYRLKDLKTTRAKLGFSLTGMQVYNPHTNQIDQMHKQKCRDISTRDEVLQCLQRFVSCRDTQIDWASEVYSGDGGVLARLRELTEWFATQSAYHFSSASVLVIYEGAASRNVPLRALSGNHTPGGDPAALKASRAAAAEAKAQAQGAGGQCPPRWGNGDFRVRVCFVDFAHAIEAEGERDTNVHEGLLSLLRALEEVVGRSNGSGAGAADPPTTASDSCGDAS
mmetsp:Transcript_9507/g.19688  ORF Transcript_9507/g.19688 Transcript_9507/m.19688 type:complete len:353 (-) Transcript_9507:206-1264(-)|eukprot:CAMPEP_0118937724 /NCGR_PEP_ID=MMETSP1169-20130426/23596_1 /TAXON_ID=36882 /ORGANISM="Pyramimonas obovata, Strain CCMP722" /LENGTH=352 /DNA_ID=CAMNT_0006881443 /DNA_START=233 /DNA_END=1291 /DNA_ORIENTATION=-